MLPPSDSFLHQSRKLAEVAANAQNRLRATPPPPYSPTVQRGNIHEEVQSEFDDDADADEAAGLWETSHTTVTIHIDASISVVGNGNSIIIPSSVAGSADTPSSSSTPSSTSPPSTAAILQSVQKQRQTKLSDMATSIIAALHRTGLLDSTDRKPAPVGININTGIKVEGSRNAICAGAVGRLGRKDTSVDGDNKVQLNTRKRRAQSEPPEIPKPKRNLA